MKKYDGNAAWHALSDAGPATPREIEEALAIAKSGRDWRVENAGSTICSRKTKRGQHVRYKGWDFESISECARIIGLSKAEIRVRALDPSDHSVKFLYKNWRKS